MRFKRRYFCVEIIFEEDQHPDKLSMALEKVKINKLKHTNLSDAIHKSIERFYGDYGMAVMMPSFSVIYFNSNTNLAILRTARELKTKFHNLLMFMRQIDQFNVTFKVIHISGSIKKSKKFLLGHCSQRLNDLYKRVNTNTGMESNTIEENKQVINLLEKLVDACESNTETIVLK